MIVKQLSCCTMQQLQHPRDVPTRREDGREHLSCLPLRTSGCGVRQASRESEPHSDIAEHRCSEGTWVSTRWRRRTFFEGSPAKWSRTGANEGQKQQQDRSAASDHTAAFERSARPSATISVNDRCCLVAPALRTEVCCFAKCKTWCCGGVMGAAALLCKGPRS